MENKKLRAAFAVCAALFVVALVVITVLSRYNKAESAGDIQGRVVLSEILASNRTYPNADGRLLDFIELRNLTDGPVDISGYKLSDDGVSIGYIFPEGSVIPAGGYVLCWCDPDSGDEAYADFGISRKGGDTVVLFNSANVVIDEIAVPHMDANIPLVRRNDGSWGTAEFASPGYENSPAGYAAWLHAMGGDDTRVVISEIQSANTCTMLDGSGSYSDWVELLNAGESTVTLRGAWLSDDAANRTRWAVPELTLAPGERRVIRCVGKGARTGEADFALSKSGCTVILTGAYGNILSQVECPALAADHAWVLQEDGSYADVSQATPGFENTGAGAVQYLRAMGADLQGLIISEIQTRNRSGVLNAAGALCDWAELWNTGDAVAVLDGAYLSDEPENRAKWRIPQLTLAPGERAVICFSGAGAAQGEADFSLAAAGCTLSLTGPAGNVLYTVDCPRIGADRVWALQSDGSYKESDIPTPGYENSNAGRAEFLAAQLPAGKLVISEVMPSNDRYLRQSDGNYYDWLELYNASDEVLALSEYSLSTDADIPDMFPLPEKTLAPGERVLVICSDNTALRGYIQAPFTLSRAEDFLYLTGPDGRFSDYLRIYDVPYQASVGRAGDCGAPAYFATPTPNQKNPEGLAGVSAAPELLTEGGVFDGIKSLRVEFAAGAEIHYTLDGSEPTARSPLYSGPIELDRTTVVRAAAFETGKFRSRIVTASYIINENHTLPVMSIAAEPTTLFGSGGIYSTSRSDVEVPCSFELYEEAGSFAIDCGLELYGHTVLKNPKKNLKVNFRGRYGSDVLSYPVYGEDGPQIYDALCLRAGQDAPFSIIRDELFVSLVRQMGDNVLVQRDKYCVLYINGEYFGIFCLKEAFNKAYYAQNHHVSEESVTVLQAPVAMNTEVFELLRFCHRNDMSVQENYAYIADRVDLDSLIDWMIIEGYCSNGDVQQNLRYFKSSEDGDRWQLAFYDLDWAFYYHLPFLNILSPEKSLQHMGFSRELMHNADFRARFLERLGQVLETTLSEENVLATIDGYAALLDPEVPRERARWDGSYAGWVQNIERLRSFITEVDYTKNIIDNLRSYIGLTAAETELYFGG